MKIPRLVLLMLLLLFCFIFSDFPGAKIVFVGVIVTIITAYVYKRLVMKSYSITRYMDTHKIFMGVQEDTSIMVTNNLFLPIHALLITDYADLNISIENAHYFLVSLTAGGSELFTYKLFGRKRGKYFIGPTSVTYSDIFGIYSFKIELDTRRDMVVFPNILMVNNMSYRSMQPYGAIRNRMPIFEDPSIIIGLREYQYGDEMKRINWKVSSKYDSLYVNTYQPSISSGSMIILDMLDTDYDFRNKDYYIERAIEVAASIVRELFLMRQEIGFASNCRIDREDAMLKTIIGKGEAHFTGILTHLAFMESNRTEALKNLLDPSVLNLAWGTSIYMITPRLDEISLYKLIDIHQSGHSITIINVGPEIQSHLSLWSIGFQSYYAEIEGNLINLMRI